MSEPQFATRLGAGDPVVGVWSVIGHPVVAEVLTETVDFVVLDGEHSENTIDDIANGIRAIEATAGDVAPVVRVSAADETELRRVLDLGPAAVIVPQIESVDEARRAVAATRYPPEGVRGVAGGRASGYGTNVAETVARANESVATVLQIETAGAVDDVEEIAALDGLDALFVGPADLSARLGVFGEFESDEFRAAMDRVVTAADAADVPVGTLATDPATVQHRWEWGMDFFVTGTDVGYLRTGASTYRAAFEEATTGSRDGPSERDGSPE
jgi:2-dehydro-3-deoxyglucarate aldolase